MSEHIVGQMDIEHNKKEFLSCNIIAFIVFANALQEGLTGIFNASLPVWPIYALVVATLFFINKFKIDCLANLILFFAVVLLYVSQSLIFFNENTGYYMKEFVISALPLIIVFLFKNQYVLLAKIFNYYAAFGALIYFYLIFEKPELFVIDYMTYGFHAIFCVSFLIINSFYNKKYFLFLLSLALAIPILVYGSRGILVILLVMFSCMLFLGIQDKLKTKAFAILSLIFIGLYGLDLLKMLIEIVLYNFDIYSYSLKNFETMFLSNALENIFGPRYFLYIDAIDVIRDNALLGIGIGMFHTIYGIYPHNIFLDIFSTFGLVFGTTIILLLLVIGKKVLKKCNHIEIKIFFVFLLANMSRLLLSKTFVYDNTIWLYITMSLNIITLYQNINGGHPIDNNSNTKLQ